MKILFILPELDSPLGFNSGPACLSACLKRAGHDARLIHLNEKIGYPLDLNRISQEVHEYCPDLIGFSVLTNQYQNALKIARVLKARVDVPFVCGGMHPTVAPEEVMGSRLFDYVCVGEGEQALLELTAAIEAGRSTENIANMWVKKDLGVIKNPVRPFISLDELPQRDYELYDFQKIIDASHGCVGVLLSRGCPYRCSYCHNHVIVDRYKTDTGLSVGKLNYIRFQPVEKIISEIKYIMDRYDNVRQIMFLDDLFSTNTDYVLEFCEAYRERIGLPFFCNAHVKKFDEIAAKALKSAGCYLVKFGVESGSERVRVEVMNRHMTNKDISRVFRIAHAAGLETSAFVLHGLPGESAEDLMMTVDLLALVRPTRFRWSMFYPFPGTVAAKIADELGLINKQKSSRLKGFMGESCLEFDSAHQTLLARMHATLSWQVNARMNGKGAHVFEGLNSYMKKAAGPKAMPNLEEIRKMDSATSAFLSASGAMHYKIIANGVTAELVNGN